ncbi:MAG: PEGA domain-containing protein [Alphaproteobacteria bacterium]|nr:PEGA domain-containing protein [Alphaproteobacteria bacterium]
MPTRTSFRAVALLGAVCLLPLLPGPAFAQDGGPAELPRDGQGTLKVTSATPGAQVWVDNVRVGEVPYTGPLAAGTHTVRVAADFFDPFVRRVTVGDGKTVDLNAAMVAGNGTVEFVVEPLGATLTLNRREEYIAPVRVSDLDPGKYEWELKKEGYEARSGEFRFERGQNLLLVENLSSSDGRFVVESRPEGANVFLDGQAVGQTPLSLDAVEPGEHQVLMELRGYAAVLRTVDTSDGRKGEVSAKLPEKGAALVVKTPSGKATVRLNGVLVGSGRRVRLPELERGRYTLAVDDAQKGSAQTRIDVREKGSSHWKAKLRGAESTIESYTPAHQSWLLWTGLGVVAGGATAGGVIAYNASIPDPTPEGDIVVSTP